MQAITLNEARAKRQVTEKSLEDVIDSRGRHYQSVFALTFHFARDQTGGADGSATFVNIACSLGVENSDFLSFQIWGTNQGQPQNTPLCRSSRTSSSIAPHERIPKLVCEYLYIMWPWNEKKEDELVFCAHSAYPRSFRFHFTLNPLFAPFKEISFDKIDAVTIFDRCPSALPTSRSSG